MPKIKLSFELLPEQSRDRYECNNFLGFERIDIIEFNYDNEGNALVYEDNELSYYCPDTLRFIMFSGWYKEIINSENTLPF